jgi:hypothetical protein
MMGQFPLLANLNEQSAIVGLLIEKPEIKVTITNPQPLINFSKNHCRVGILGAFYLIFRRCLIEKSLMLRQKISD